MTNDVNFGVVCLINRILLIIFTYYYVITITIITVTDYLEDNIA